MLIYRERDNLFYRLHPLTPVAFAAVVVLLSLIFTHPFFLLGLLLAVGTVIVSSGNLNEWKYYLLAGMGMLVIIMLINAVIVRAGSTVLFYGPWVPLLGNIRITLEALCFGGVMGIRLLVILSAFCFYTHVVSSDKVLRLCGRYSNKSVVAANLSLRLLPLLIRDARRITGVMRCRGVKMDTGGAWRRIKSRLPVINVLLLSSLERSLQVAESMHARGYGSGERTHYARDRRGPGDYIILTALTFALAYGIGSYWQGNSLYTFYPRLDSLQLKDARISLTVAAALMIPALLNWGWTRWPLLKLKI